MSESNLMLQEATTRKGRQWRSIPCVSLALLLAGLVVACGPSISRSAPATPSPVPPEAGRHKVVVYFFWGDGCPHCEAEKRFLEQLTRRYPEVEVRMYEVWHDQENLKAFQKMAQAYGITLRGVPVTFIGDFEAIVGYADYMANDIESKIKYCLENGCIDPGEKGGIKKATPEAETKTVLRLPIVGELELSSMPLYLMTAIVALVDGFNPCSLWLISLLLAVVIASGSRKKVLAVGLTFLLVTATVYGLLMVGLLSVFRYVGYMSWIQVVVAIVALVFGAVNIKDYFWLKKGVSFTIPDRFKPKIVADIRGIRQADRSTWAMVGGTVVMALGVALVEFPCTAGFPLIWTNIIAQHHVSVFIFGLLLATYLLIYLLDELGVVVATTVALKGRWFEERHGRTLKLIGGMIMLALAVVMLVKPKLMNEISGTLLVFGSAIAASFLVMFVHRKVLPRYGVYVGTKARP